MITIDKIINKKLKRLLMINFYILLIQFFIITSIVYFCACYLYELSSCISDTGTLIVNKHPLSYKNIAKYSFIPVSVTAYPPDPKHTDDTPYLTASGNLVEDGTCALSNDIEKRCGYKFGDEVIVYGIGIFKFNDRTNARLTNTVDIFFYNKQKCLDFGRKYGIIMVSNKSIINM
jgi:3D (Asp-Asp-Asp) domain-containing protein